MRIGNLSAPDPDPPAFTWQVLYFLLPAALSWRSRAESGLSLPQWEERRGSPILKQMTYRLEIVFAFLANPCFLSTYRKEAGQKGGREGGRRKVDKWRSLPRERKEKGEENKENNWDDFPQGEKRRLCPRLNVGLRLFLAQLVVLAHLVPGVSTQLSWQEERVACWLGCRRVFMLNIQ